jgi:hypothetical protein
MFLGLFGSGQSFANNIQGVTRDDQGNVLGGVDVRAYKVGTFEQVAQATSDSTTGRYTLDPIDSNVMVVLVFTLTGKKPVTVPTPQTPTTSPGGALSVRENISGLDVVLYSPPSP